MQSHRVFIAINFSEKIKEKLWLEANQFADLPIRITKKESLHLTLAFIGYVDNDELVLLINNLPQIAERHDSFELNINHLVYGPDEKHSRMIWLKGEVESELLALQEDLNKSLENINLRFFHPEKRVFTVHVTLARMKKEEWRNWQNKPEINKEVKLKIPANSIELMASNLKRSGAEYTVLQSLRLDKLINITKPTIKK